ncbi:MAG: BNR-4 repeat-containing protein [Pseudomonadota bacterium]
MSIPWYALRVSQSGTPDVTIPEVVAPMSQPVSTAAPVPLDLAALAIEGAFWSARETHSMWRRGLYAPARENEGVRHWQPVSDNGFGQLQNFSGSEPSNMGDAGPYRYMRLANGAMASLSNTFDDGVAYLSMCYHARPGPDGIIARLSDFGSPGNRLYIYTYGVQLGTGSVQPIAAFQKDVLHHLAVQRRADNTCDVWLDGVLVVDNAPIPGGSVGASGPLALGAFGTSNLPVTDGGLHSAAILRADATPAQRAAVDAWVRAEAAWSAPGQVVPADPIFQSTLPGVVIEDATWLFLQEPRMLPVASGRMLAGTIDGSTPRVHVFDQFGLPIASHVSGLVNDPDDHNNGTLLQLLDGSVLSFQNNHNFNNMFLMRSTDDGTSFSTPVDVQPQLAATEISYPYPVQMSDGTIYLFYRGKENGGGPRDFLWSKSTDNGTTWTAGVTLLENSGGSSSWAPYVALTQDGDRIHFICSTGHPDAEAPNMLFYFYWEGEQAFDAAGNSVALPARPADVLTPVDDGSTGEAFPLDIIVAGGVAYGLWMRNIGLKDLDDFNDRIDLVRGRLTGSNWDVEIVKTNAGLQLEPGNAQALYGGKAVFTPGNPGEVWAGIRESLSDWHQICRLARNGGPEWPIVQVLTEAYADCVRPYTAGTWLGYTIFWRYDSINSFEADTNFLNLAAPSFAGNPLQIEFTEIDAADSSESGTEVRNFAVPVITDNHNAIVITHGIAQVTGVSEARLDGVAMTELLNTRQAGSSFQGYSAIWSGRVSTAGTKEVAFDFSGQADVGIAVFTISDTGQPLEVFDNQAVVTTEQAVRSVTVTAPPDDGRQAYVIVAVGTVNTASFSPNADLLALDLADEGDARSNEFVKFRFGQISPGQTLTFEDTCSAITAIVVR